MSSPPANANDNDSGSRFVRLFRNFFGISAAPWNLKQYQFGMALYQFATISFGWFVLFLRSCMTGEWKHFPLAVLWSLGIAASASLVGFLFGIPKTGRPEAPGAGANSHGAASRDQLSYSVNTNLEDISDWLTKIIVGLTLVEFRTFASAFHDTAETLAQGMGGTPTDIAFAQATLIYFAAAGMFGGYVLTRLYLASAFRMADAAVVARISGDVADARTRLQTLEGRVASMEGRSNSRGRVFPCCE